VQLVEEKFFTLQEVADALKVNYMTVYRWVRAGKLPAYKFGTEWRVEDSDLREFIAARRVSSTE
jgi:excisionase family DNA binding protein